MPRRLLFGLLALLLLCPLPRRALAEFINGNLVIAGSTNSCAPAGASGTTYTCNLESTITQYTVGAYYSFKADVANTGASTINYNAAGAKTIKKLAGNVTTDLVAGDLCASQMVVLLYDGTNMQMVSPVCTSTSLPATVVKTDQANTWTTGAQDMGSATSFKVPTSNPATPTASGLLAYDSGSNTLEYGENGTNRVLVARDSSDTLTNKTLDTEGTGNTVTLAEKYWFPAAQCNNATARLEWDTPTTNQAVAACVTGTNTQKGVADFADGANLSLQRTLQLPSDWTGALDVKFVWFTAGTSGVVVWQAATICTASGETDDPAFNTPSENGTGVPAANQLNMLSITGVTATGCAAGELLHLKVFRDSGHVNDTLAATVRLIGVEVTLRRAL